MKTLTLDTDEYFHLALYASSVSDPHACISYLDEVLQRQPGNARALYLRAVQHAELGLTARAMSGIREALAIEPALAVAQLHLGLLMLVDRERADEARQYLLGLASGADPELRKLVEGLTTLTDDQLPIVMKRLLQHLLVRRDSPR